MYYFVKFQCVLLPLGSAKNKQKTAQNNIFRLAQVVLCFL